MPKMVITYYICYYHKYYSHSHICIHKENTNHLSSEYDMISVDFILSFRVNHDSLVNSKLRFSSSIFSQSPTLP